MVRKTRFVLGLDDLPEKPVQFQDVFEHPIFWHVFGCGKIGYNRTGGMLFDPKHLTLLKTQSGRDVRSPGVCSEGMDERDVSCNAGRKSLFFFCVFDIGKDTYKLTLPYGPLS